MQDFSKGLAVLFNTSSYYNSFSSFNYETGFPNVLFNNGTMGQQFYHQDNPDVNLDKNNYTFQLQSNSNNTGGLGEFKNVIGISLLRCCLISGSNITAHFIDIIIPEIPYKACIHNSNRYNLIARLGVKKDSSNEMIEYEPINIKENT